MKSERPKGRVRAGESAENRPNSERRDHSRWFVPIAVATIAAVGTVLAAIGPTLFGDDGDGRSDPAVASSTGASNAGQPGSPGGPNPSAAGGTSPSAAVVVSGRGLIHFASPAYDLDSNAGGEDGDKIADITRSDTGVAATGGSRLVLLGVGEVPNPQVCGSALDARSVDRIDAADLRSGATLCVRTSAGHPGAVTLDMVQKIGEQLGLIQFSYVLWNA